MNRGHELMLRDDPPDLAAALAAYDEAIAQLRPLATAPEADPSVVNGLGAALMNRGQLLHRQHGIARSADALAAYTEAVEILRPLERKNHAWARRNLAGSLLNRANLQLDLGDHTRARADARESLTLAAPGERTELVDADLALKARRALCDALGRLLVGAGETEDVLAAEASDLVDDALALIRHGQARGTPFHALALRFFRFGTQLYRVYQPHFLAEFIRENLPVDDAEFRAVALDAIQTALHDGPRAHPRLTIGDVASERHLHTTRELENLLREIPYPTSTASLPA